MAESHRAPLAARDPWLVAAGLLLMTALAWLLFGVRDLPICDLPQHAAQLAVWVHLEDARFGFAEHFELQGFTPNMAAYLLARPWVALLGVLGAMKALLWFTALAHVLCLGRLLVQADRDPWWALLGVPLSLGFSFYFGFLNFLVATPLVLWLLAESMAWREGGGRRRWLGMGALACALFFAHGLAHGFGLLLVVTTLCADPDGGGAERTLRRRALGALALVPSVALAILWSPQLGALAELGPMPDRWGLGIERLLDLPATWLGVARVDRAATLAGLGLVGLVLIVHRPARITRLCVPLLLTLAFYFFFPMKLRGLHLLGPRFAVFVLPFLLLALQPRVGRRGPHALLVIFVGAWLGFLAQRFTGFQAETEGFHRVTEGLPMGQRLRPLIFDPGSASLPGGAPLLHLVALNQVQRGGRVGFSFSRYPSAFARYRPGHALSTGLDFRPRAFSYAQERGAYDYYVVRSAEDPWAELFADARGELVPLARAGPWRLYGPPEGELTPR